MQSFLELVSRDLVTRFGEEISEVTLVFPSRRAGLFFNTYLSKQINKPIWAPNMSTINDLMQQITGLNVDDPISLVTKLYTIYKKVKKSEEPFETFYYWGEVMLNDFDQVDKYLVNPEELFSNIKDIKDIEERFGGLTPEQSKVLQNYIGVMNEGEVSELRDNYLTVWGMLFEIYTQFNNKLEKENLAYEGMVYRKAADILQNPKTIATLPKNIAFIGFNALNECEKKLLQRCKTECNALYYWDYDPFFVDNQIHEAGLFIRDNLKKFPNALSREVFLRDTTITKTIKLVAAPSTVAQTKLVPRVLNEIENAGGKLDVSTAIVFPKENILIPTLQAIPPDIDSLNITMGYPIRETPAYSLAEILVKLQINAQKSSKGVIRFYHHDVLAVLNHPYIRLCEQKNSTSIASHVKRNNRIYPKDSELAVSKLFTMIFSLLQPKQPITDYILNICNFIAQEIARKTNEEEKHHLRIDLEFLFSLHKSLTRLGSVLTTLDFEISHKVFQQLLRKVFVQERVSFKGEPLAGLQVMGFLETRALDFENVVILSFNDDILPGRSNQVSFITPSLRIGFGLPDYKHHDSVYAYYFYRLLTRAKNVYLIYSSRTEGLSSGEKSRYGLQLQMEKVFGDIEIIPVSYDLSLIPSPAISIKKDDEVIKRLLANLRRDKINIKLSPSGLTTYLTCSLRFYFRYVLGLKEDDEVTEEIGALEFGKIIHNTMEELYKEFNNKTVTEAMVKSILSKPNLVEDTLDNVFAKIFLNDSTLASEELSGRNILARNAMLYTIKKMLRLDAQRAPFNLVMHEKEIYVNVKVPNSPIVNEVQLGGFVDRIELNNGTVWSIDYKTGKHDKQGKFTLVEDLFNPELVKKHKEVFQTFCYSLALMEVYSETPIKPALWFVKTAKDVSDFDVNQIISKKDVPVNDFRLFEKQFSEQLQTLLSEIFDPNIPFSQTSNIEKCRICPFNKICSLG
jgi:CRISPR/Cas system-associated exonuclease Cas4 (RecB family)